MKQVIFLSMSILSILFLQTAASSNVFAESADTVRPIISSQGDIYYVSTIPTPVSFSLSAIDNVDGKLRVDCDKISSLTVFKIGKTTVRCIAVDSAGNEARTSFVVTVGNNFVMIPDWVKGLTKYWVNQQITDAEYTTSLKYLMEQKIVHVPYSKSVKNNISSEIPVWIKTNSQMWVDGKMSVDEFSIGIQRMLERGSI
ncbi:MAG: HYR domain-containing protein [Nitrosopumilaceae archaeon]